MPDIFISYAEEDSGIARKVAEHLKKKGFNPYYYEDPKIEGNNIIENIEKALKKSKIFLFVLSPDYLSSKWCKAEFEVAFLMQLEASTKGEEYEIHPLKVKEVETGNLVFERRYVQTDLTKGSFDEKFNQFIDNKLVEKRTVEGKTKSPRGWLPFQNRESELHKLETNLDNLAGSHFYLVVAPPQMGKSWLLLQLSRKLIDPKLNWIVQYFDLQTDHEARSNIKKILVGLNFQVDELKSNDNEELCLAAAKQIKDSGKYWLLLLDSVEHISDQTAKQFRTFLGGLSRRLEPVSSRIAVVAASRTELLPFKGHIPKPNFEILELTPFSQNVIVSATRATNKDTGALLNYQDISDRLLKLTEGLPELITRYLDWMRIKTGFAFIPEDLEKDTLYKDIVVAYIEEALLSARVLLPYIPSSNVQEELRQAWARFVVKASSFRIITRSHIRFMTSEEIMKNMSSLPQMSPDLLDAVGKLHLVIPTQTMWYQIAPPIRRLLFHYNYRTNTEKLQVHKQNELLYKGWKNKLSGTDALRFTIEKLWHYSEQIRIHISIGKKKKNNNIEDYFQKLCDDLKPNGESFFDQLVGLSNLIANDEELTTSLEEIEIGLSERIYVRIEKLKEGHHEA